MKQIGMERLHWHTASMVRGDDQANETLRTGIQTQLPVKVMTEEIKNTEQQACPTNVGVKWI